MTFGALPSIAASKLYLDSTQGDYKWSSYGGKITPAFIFVMQFATIATSGLLTALAGLALYFVALRLGASMGGAVFGALAFGLATPVWGWATAFFGHASAAAYLFLGLASILYLFNLPSSRARDIALGFASGAFLSWAVVIEYTSAPAAAIIAVYGMYGAWKWERERLLRVMLSAIAGATIFILPLLIYNYMVYGDFFASGYRYHSTFTATKEGFYGIERPRVRKIARLLLGIKRGIFWFSPLLLFIPIALYRQWKTPALKGLAVTIFAIILYYFLWNSGYTYWTGGSATGPRFLTPILPFACLSLAFLWSRAGNLLKSALVLFFGISFFFSLMSVSVSMMGLRTPVSNIITDYLWPKFIEASSLKISLLFGLVSPLWDGSSHLHLVPLYVVLALGGVYILWQLRIAKRKGFYPTD